MTAFDELIDGMTKGRDWAWMGDTEKGLACGLGCWFTEAQRKLRLAAAAMRYAATALSTR